jgi:hypothetical protein
VLVTQPPGKNPATFLEYRSLAWFSRSHPLTILPAVSSLKALRRNAQSSQATKPFVVGNPLLDGPDQRLQNSVRQPWPEPRAVVLRRSRLRKPDLLLVLIGDGGNWLRHGEDDVEVADVEKLRSTVVQPLGASQALALRTMPISTRVVTDALMSTVIALLDVTTKRCGSTFLDCTHDATLGARKRRAMVLAISFTVAAEDIRHFQPAAGHR